MLADGPDFDFDIFIHIHKIGWMEILSRGRAFVTKDGGAAVARRPQCRFVDGLMILVKIVERMGENDIGFDLSDQGFDLGCDFNNLCRKSGIRKIATSSSPRNWAPSCASRGRISAWPPFSPAVSTNP
jgi:hypothetical protein